MDLDQGIHLTQILNYYRSRVEAFETDRTQWYSKLEQLRVRQELVHRTDWELRKRLEEKTELEGVHRQLQNALTQERDRIVGMKQEADRLRIKGKENR